MATLVANNHHLAVTQLSNSLTGWDVNGVVAPPLTYAALRSLGAAASDDSLTQIRSLFDLAPTPYIAAQQTARVASQSWADRGRQFRTEFLSANDALGPLPRFSTWLAGEAGFTDNTASGDAVLAQALSATSTSLSLGSFDTPTDIRLLVTHTLRTNANWSAVTPFVGIFERGEHDLLRMPMLRLTAGVTRYVGTDFTADLLAAGDLRVMSLRPANGALSTFATAPSGSATSRLETALAEAIQGLMADGAVPVAGEMVLPQANLALPIDVDEPLRRAGASLVYDEINADLRSLDGVGGTYVQAVSPPVALRIAADGLSLQAAHAMAFTFSPRNTHGRTYGVVGYNVTLPPISTCVWPTPDLRSFFLIILDTRQWVVSAVAVQALPGTAVTPVCTP